ncbi:hypothetical protein [Rhizobium acidisoli]|nr:hypothetical protein [Rhizobium acidisoli]
MITPLGRGRVWDNLGYGLNHGSLQDGDRLWGILSLVFFVPILTHG